MVEKDDLIKAVWPDTFVEEGALTRNISLLRKTIGDSGTEAEYVETIPKRGYRFVAPIRTVTAESKRLASVELGKAELVEIVVRQPRKWSLKRMSVAAVLLLATTGLIVAVYAIRARPLHPVTSVRASESALAVLPFRTFKSDPSQDYFADGITQALITGLAKLGNVRVISLASDVSRQQGFTMLNALGDQSVNRVLTGTVLRSGGRIRIDAQLIDPRTRAVLWANYYARDITDVMALELEVAEAIAKEIQVTITADARQRLQQNRKIDPEALDQYLRGRYFWNRRTDEGLRKAIQYFQRAIAADPTYALAYTGLADSYSLLGSIGVDGMPPNQAMPL